MDFNPVVKQNYYSHQNAIKIHKLKYEQRREINSTFERVTSVYFAYRLSRDLYLSPSIPAETALPDAKIIR